MDDRVEIKSKIVINLCFDDRYMDSLHHYRITQILWSTKDLFEFYGLATS